MKGTAAAIKEFQTLLRRTVWNIINTVIYTYKWFISECFWVHLHIGMSTWELKHTCVDPSIQDITDAFQLQSQ